MNENPDTIDEKPSLRAGVVHLILSYSYGIFLFAVILGSILDIFYKTELFFSVVYQYVGFVFIILGSILIYWAQETSASLVKAIKPKLEEHDFARGPYKYSRNPTHIGLTIMTLGLALLLNSFWSVVLLIVAAFITKMLFVKKEEVILEAKYGQAYMNYKKKVRTWV